MTKDNPLAAWLEKAGMRQKEFAELVSAVRGWGCSQPDVSHWCTGGRKPGRNNQHWINLATRGAVTPRMWSRWERARAAG